MTPPSNRFLGAVLALLVATAVPVWIHALTRPVQDACTNAEGFYGAETIAGATPVEWPRKPREIRGFQGELETGTTHNALAMRVLRTTEPAPLYGTPFDHAFQGPLYLERSELRILEAGPYRLPTHWVVVADHKEARIEAYLYSQAGRPTRHPVTTGVSLGLDQLFGGTYPLDVFIVAGSGAGPEVEALETAMEAWLVEAWQQFARACEATR